MRAQEFINEISDEQLQRYLDRAGSKVDRRMTRMAQARDRLNKGYEIYHADTPGKIVHKFEARTPAEAQRYYADYIRNYESDVDYDLRLRRATGLIEARARYEMTDLDPWTFDQTPAGWRSLPTSARQADAIKSYIDAYVKNGQFVGAPEGAKTLRPYILYWHLGQVLTQMGRNGMAVGVMRQALDDDPGWNAYVMATISFLRKDRRDFDHWAPLARGNEETIKRLTAGWGLPYKQAYAGKTLNEAFDQPYPITWEKSDHGDYDALATLDDGTYLSIMFNNEGDDEYQIEFHRNNSQAVTGEGDAQRVFATVLAAIQQFLKVEQPWKFIFSASKEVEPGQNAQSRAQLYDRLMQRYAGSWGYDIYHEDHGDQVTYELTKKKSVEENFADGKKPGRKGLSKRVGIPKKATLGQLEKIAKSSTGEKRRMAQWQLNMRRGKKNK